MCSVIVSANIYAQQPLNQMSDTRTMPVQEEKRAYTSTFHI